MKYSKQIQQLISALMKRRFSRVAMILAIVAGSVYLGFAPEQLERVLGTVTNNTPGSFTVLDVSDGDTIVIDMNGTEERVRIIGIDTPELHHPEKPVQCFAQAAQIELEKLIDTQPVRLEADGASGNRDRYNRLLRYVYTPDGTDVAAELIRNGYGFSYTIFEFDKLREYDGYETTARQNLRGLWSGCSVTADGQQEQTEYR